DQSISRRNKMFWHTARDDTMFTAMRCISRHEDTQVYETPKPKYVRKKVDSDTSPKQKPVQDTKGTRLKTKAKVAKSDKKKQPAKIGSSDGTDFESGVSDEQHLKMTSADEGTSTIRGVPNVHKYESESEKESWGDSGEEDKDDGNDSEDKSDGNDDDDANDDNQEGDDMNDDDKETDRFKKVEEDAHVKLTPVLETQKIDKHVQSSSVSSEFTSKLLNLKNPSPADNEIVSLMDTTARHVITVPEITSSFTTTIHPLPLFFNPFLQQATPTPTPTTSEATTSFPSLLDFSSVFRFNDRVTNLEKDLSEIKQVDQYAQALSSIPAIVDRYIDNKLGKAINKAIQAHNLDCRQEAQNEKNEYVKLVDTSMRTIIKEEVTTQLPQILPQASTYEAAASLSEFELIKILLDKMEESKSHLRVDYKKKLYDALVKTKRRKLSKEAESSRDSRSKEKKSSSTSKDASQSQHKHSGKSAHAEEPSHTLNDLGVQQNQEFDTGNNDEQLADKEITKADCQVAHATEPRTSFDELMDTSFDFSAFVLNRLNIKDLTQEILVGPAFELLKGTCKSLTELEYYLKECSKATTERLDWNNPKGKPYPFDLSKPLPLIRDHRGRQVIPRDFFINNDLEYLKGGDLSRRYSTSVTKTKATTYEIKWIEDLVHNLWSPVKVAANMSSLKDVYSRKRIIAITRLSIMKKYDYGHLEEIKVRREDQKLYKFREGDFPRLCLQDIEDMLFLLVQKKLTNLTINEWYDLNVALRNKDGISAKEEMERFRQTKGLVIIQDINKQLYERRLMWNLKKFIGGREYGNDLSLLERTI
ncbi:hypothetical protein Tco_1341819, partial [Tanacetum coccineum]